MFITLGFPSSKQLLHPTGSGLQFGVGTCMQGCEYKFPLLQGCMHSWARWFPGSAVAVECTNKCPRIHREGKARNTWTDREDMAIAAFPPSFLQRVGVKPIGLLSPLINQAFTSASVQCCQACGFYEKCQGSYPIGRSLCQLLFLWRRVSLDDITYIPFQSPSPDHWPSRTLEAISQRHLVVKMACFL